jgi:hypothetical protein
MSCLFRSLSYFISNLKTEELRYIITDYISKDPILIQPDTRLSTILSIDEISLDTYSRNMRKSETWGGAIEIKTFCELFKIKVSVYVISERRYIDFFPTDWDGNRCIKISWTGNHYEPLE